MTRRIVAWCTVLLLVATAGAQQGADTYLADVGSNPDTTGGVSRLLHYLPGDVPITVYVPEPDGPDGAGKREAVLRAVRAWQQAAPDVVSFLVVGEPSADALQVRWQDMGVKAGSYRYAYSITADNQYRFQTTDVLLDPRHDPGTLERFALLEFGHALGLLGRSPHQGDALSAAPSGVVTPRDVATLRALYAVPSGTELNR